MRLYHFTCRDHGEPGIRRDGFLRPNPHPLLPNLGPVVWLTDLEVPDRFALGLTRTFIRCDRTEIRYSLYTDALEGLSWWPFVRQGCPPAAVADLERNGRPLHWWVCREPAKVAAL